MTIEWAPTLRSRRIPATTAAERREEARENAGVFHRAFYVPTAGFPSPDLRLNFTIAAADRRNPRTIRITISLSP